MTLKSGSKSAARARARAERTWFQRLTHGWRRLRRNRPLVLMLLSGLVGVAASVAAIAFRYLIDLVQGLAFGVHGEAELASLAGLPWWRVLLAPVIGGLLIGLFVYYFMPRRRPQAVQHVIEASALHGGRMSLSVGIKAAVVSAASIGFGASVGREGPVVHLGASLGAWLAKQLHLGRGLSRTLLGCGVAAAVSASFNAPIAGVFFALEVVIGHYALSAFAPVVVAGVAGTIVSRMHYGDFPAFVLTRNYEIASFLEFPAFALLGVVSAVAAICFMRSIMLAEDLVERTALPGWFRPVVGGLGVGAIAIFFPEILGVGYAATDAALSELLPLWLLLALIALKTLATALSLGSGFGGGVFSPSLFVGAMVGGAFGVIATSAFPELSSGHGAYTIVGMGAVAGAVLGAPISTILIIFEMTGDYALTIAVMIGTSIASLITQQVQGGSFFLWQLQRRGISIGGGREVGLLRALPVSSIMDARFDAVAPDAPLQTVRQKLQKAELGELFVVDQSSRFHGVITFSDLSSYAFDTSRDATMTAVDVARNRVSILQAEDSLEHAVEVIQASGEALLPVVGDLEGMKMVGVAHEHDIMLAYHRAIQQARREERGEL